MRIIFRVDASEKIGMGHWIRCLALAQTFRDQGESVLFLSAKHPHPDCLKQLAVEGIRHQTLQSQIGSTVDAKKTSAFALAYGADLIILDGYSFSSSYQSCLKQAGHRLLLIDDFCHLEEYCTDFILNQNSLVLKNRYHAQKNKPNVLLGSTFALLRREFLKSKVTKLRIKEKSLLVMFGGSDPFGLTEKTLLSLIPAFKPLRPHCQIHVVIGSHNQRYAKILKLTRPYSWIHVKKNPLNLISIMKNSTAALTAAGSTCWELAYLGVPMMAIVVAKNQTLLAKTLQSHKAAHILRDPINFKALGHSLLAFLKNGKELAQMIKSQRRLVDGKGSLRVYHTLKQNLLTLRPITLKDRHRVWQWANDRETRSLSFSSDKISWDSHKKWFRKKLKDPFCHFFMGEKGNKPVGHIRYDVQNRKAVLSLTVAPEWRGRGIGNDLVRISSFNMFQKTRIKQIEAYVLPQNKNSMNLFHRNQFKLVSHSKLHGKKCAKFVLAK